MVTAALQTTMSSCMAPIDESHLLQGMIEHFGAEAVVPMHIPADFWNAAATKMTRSVSARHGNFCLTAGESDNAFVMAVAEEEAKKLGAKVACMPGRLADMSSNETFGIFDGDDGWIDGQFTQALRALVNQDQPGWLLVFCGEDKVANEQWEVMNSLLDDNKKLCLASGEVIRLRPDDRIIFVAPSMVLDDASPATVSRLGIINLESARQSHL